MKLSACTSSVDATSALSWAVKGPPQDVSIDGSRSHGSRSRNARMRLGGAAPSLQDKLYRSDSRQASRHQGTVSEQGRSVIELLAKQYKSIRA